MNTRASGARPNGMATLTYGNKRIELPVYKPTEGPDAIDIRKLYGEADVFTYDPGFTSTASCESDITLIDGDDGILLYGGYPIDQMARESSSTMASARTSSRSPMAPWSRSTTACPMRRRWS